MNPRAWWVATVLVAAACSGNKNTPGGAAGAGGNAGAGGVSGAGGSAPFTSCPAQRASAGTACAGTFNCTYQEMCTCNGCCSSLYGCMDGTFTLMGFNDGCLQGTCPLGGTGGGGSGGTQGTAGSVGSGGGGSGGGGSGGGDSGGGGPGGGGSGGGGSGGGGSGGGSVACTSEEALDTVEVTIAGSDEKAFVGTVTAAVTVTSVASCVTATCPASITPSGQTFPSATISPTATRIVLTAADARSWVLYLRYTALPADLIEAGDTLDMNVVSDLGFAIASALNQRIVLSRGGDLVAFALNERAISGAPLPSLQAFGVAVTADGACGPATGTCATPALAARVTVGTESARVSRGTARIGPLRFTIDTYRGSNTSGGCDIPAQSRMAGFRSP